MLTLVLAVTFVPTISFGAETDGNAGIDSAGSTAVNGTEPQEEWLVCDGDLDASKRQIVQKRGASNSNEARIAAHTAIRDLMDNYVDLDDYRNFSDEFNLTEAQVNELTSVAEEATAGCSTDYEKIQKIFQLVADSIYYDWDGYTTRIVDRGYDAWVSKKTICEGYADLSGIFLDCLDIPCIKMIGDDHAYNAAYDSQNECWIFFDSTWGSQNSYRDGEYHYNKYLNNNYFDMSVEYISTLNNHEIFLQERGTVAVSNHRDLNLAPGGGANVKYILKTPKSTAEWTDMDSWVLLAWLPDRNVGSAAFGTLGQYDFSIDIRTDGFQNCQKLTSVSLPEGTKHIGYEAFGDCSDLAAVHLPDSLTGIGSAAFRNCSSLTDIAIPDGVTKLDAYTFSNCSSLENITIPEGITSIGYSAFGECNSLKGDVLPENLTDIGGYAFYNCRSLESITIPKGVTSMGEHAFSNCRGLKTVTITEGVTCLGQSAFYSCYELTSITIPESMTRIENSAFSSCSGLASITIPDSVTSIGNYAFNYCRALTAIDLPDGLTDIGNGVFSNCSGLTDIILPESLTTIGESAFKNCTSLKGIRIPNGVRSIEKETFRGCSGLISATISDDTEQIGERAFFGCSKMEKIVIPDSVVTFGTYAFRSCPSLTVYCNKDSSAHSYAVENKIKYKLFISLQDCDISLAETTYHTTGEPIKPDITVKDGAATLTEGEQYRIIGSDAVVGETSVTVEGLDNYTGTVVVNYTITDHQWNDSYTVDEEATCTQEGSESIHCAVCDAVKEGSVRATEKAAHSFGDWIMPENYSCTEGGTKRKICSSCGTVVSEDVPAADHQWNDFYTVDTEAKCSEDGSKSKHCANCNAITDVTVVPATGHTFGEWEEVSASTCENEGLRQRTCDTCGFVESENLQPSGHDFEEEYTVDVPATCTTDGSRSKHCRKCDAVKDSEVVPAAGHSYGDWRIGREATCIEPGLKEKVCSGCGDKLTEELPLADHHWEAEPAVDKAATCTREGSRSVHCSVCGISDGSTVTAIPATGHVWNNARYIWSKDNASVTAIRTCRNDSKHQEKETVRTTSVAAKAATYTAMGQTRYTATFKNPAFAKQTKTVTNIAKLPKKNNTLTVKAKKVTVKYAKVKKKNQTVAAGKAFAVSKANGNVTYRKISGNKKITVSSNGKITVRKGLKKGTYKVTVRVTASGTTVYKAGTRLVKVSVMIK